MTRKDYTTLIKIVVQFVFYFFGNVCYYGFKHLENKLSDFKVLKKLSQLLSRGGDLKNRKTGKDGKDE